MPRKQGRPSVLTEPLKVEITKLITEGVPIREVARKYKIGEATLRRNFSAQIPLVKDVAQRLATVERDLAHLPISAQRVARTLADQMKDIQDSYASVAVKGAQTADKIADLAGRVMAGEAVDPNQIANAAVAAELHKAANVALAPAQALVASGKGKDIAPDDPAARPKAIEITLVRPKNVSKAYSKS